MSTSHPVHSVSLEQAQADLSGLIAQLPAQGEIVITSGSRPVAKLVATPSKGERKLGTMAGSVLYIAPDFDMSGDELSAECIEQKWDQALAALERLKRERPIGSGGLRFTREELHERR